MRHVEPRRESVENVLENCFAISAALTSSRRQKSYFNQYKLHVRLTWKKEEKNAIRHGIVQIVVFAKITYFVLYTKGEKKNSNDNS